MSAYTKNVLSWIVLMAVGLSAIAASLYVSAWFLIVLAGVIFGARFVLERIVCPQCGTPVTYQGTLAGMRVHGGFIRRQCQQCGRDLRLAPNAI